MESLARQTLPQADFEVIVVSDGSSDGTIEMLQGFKSRFQNLAVLELKNRGPGAARNAGARKASGRSVAFTDDDCLPATDWLEQILKAFERTGAAAIQGTTTTDRAARTPLTHQVEVLGPMLTSVPTCNAAYLKEAFDAAGGFDESFRFAHDEDADLAWRVEELGRIVFAPEVRVVHPPRRDGFWKRARWLRGLESDFLLFYKNPVKYPKICQPVTLADDLLECLCRRPDQHGEVELQIFCQAGETPVFLCGSGLAAGEMVQPDSLLSCVPEGAILLPLDGRSQLTR